MILGLVPQGVVSVEYVVVMKLHEFARLCLCLIFVVFTVYGCLLTCSGYDD